MTIVQWGSFVVFGF